MSSPPGGLRAVERFFLDLSSTVDADSPRRRGCLMVNTVLDARGLPDAVRGRVEGYRAMLRGGFLAALKGAASTGRCARAARC